MKPIDFKQSTKVLQRPSTMAESECQSLPVWCDGKQCVSCWKPTFKERLNILFNGKVWLGVLSGKTQPPVFVSGERVFHRTPIKAQIKAFFCFGGRMYHGILQTSNTRLQTARQTKAFHCRYADFTCNRFFAWLVVRLFSRYHCRSCQGMVGFKGTRGG